MPNHLSLAVAAAASLTLFGLAPPGAAHAEAAAPGAVSAASSCPVDEFCVWTDSPFRGHFGSFGFGVRDLATFNGGALNLAITDVWNRSNVNFCLYSAPDYGGARLVLKPTAQGRYVGAAWNDRARSLHVC
jgi:Peptidase inhibitor family I36